MSITTIRRVYNSYASIYDFVFGKVFQPGRLLCANIVNQLAPSKAHVLEAGVGTGLSLPLYRPDLFITGIDISEKMLKKAKKRIISKKLSNHISVAKMDVSNLEFADGSFDFVVAMYVASVVPDVQAFLDEINRVCKKEGHIIILNHFSSNNKTLHMLEKKLNRMHSLVGFKPDFKIDNILDYKYFKLLNSQKINAFGYWKLLHLKKDDSLIT